MLTISQQDREALRTLFDLALQALRDAEPGEEYLAAWTTFSQIRNEVRAQIDWPYAYDAPPIWGGSCLECGRTDGSHASWCEAVS